MSKSNKKKKEHYEVLNGIKTGDVITDVIIQDIRTHDKIAVSLTEAYRLIDEGELRDPNADKE